MSLIAAALGRIAAPERRTVAVACCAHILHDGYTDLLYVLLPLWQAQFGLGYAEVGLLRALYVGAMAGFQMPAGAIAQRFGGPLRSEEHTSELQSRGLISYAAFCLKKKTQPAWTCTARHAALNNRCLRRLGSS